MEILKAFDRVYSLSKKVATVELQEELLNLKEQILNIRAENLELLEKVSELKAKLTLSQNLTYDKPYYWIEAQGEREGPFCQKCYDDENTGKYNLVVLVHTIR